MKKFTLSFLVLIWICSNIQMLTQERTLQVREDGVYMYVDQMPVYPKGYSKNSEVSDSGSIKRSIRNCTCAIRGKEERQNCKL